ncbi:VWA domain-containing protein [Nonomuraea sp. NPDC049695]|uniref:VWA domain-containing protein n=1 Tax=Nonomuraea sp. NPDC049695 TaxID=3154734 RepID=UPI003424DCEF
MPGSGDLAVCHGTLLGRRHRAVAPRRAGPCRAGGPHRRRRTVTTPADDAFTHRAGRADEPPDDLGVLSFADLVARAARWSTSTRRRASALRTVEADVWDRMEWADIRANLEEVGDLVDDLTAETDYAEDLIADLWTALFQAAPVQRERAEVAPSRWVNHQIVTTLLTCPQFTGLRATMATVGDAFAAAHALTGHYHHLADLLWASTAAQQDAETAERAHAAAAHAADEVVTVIWDAAEAADARGRLPADVVAAAQAALEAAEHAEARAAAAAANAVRALQEAQVALSDGVLLFLTRAADRLKGERALLDLWGIGYEQVRRMDAAERAVLAERLRGNRLANFADLIGRFRAFAHAEAAQKITGGFGELVGTTLSDDIARAIPSELAALGVPALRAALLARMAEGRLLSYRTRGRKRVGRGPLIICLDASASMAATVTGDDLGVSAAHPSREAWAKAVTLALVDHAAHTIPRREVTVIRFSTDVDTIHHFPADRRPTVEEILALAEAWQAGGGTDYRPPLHAAADLIAGSRHDPRHRADSRAHSRADIVFLTDGEHYGGNAWFTDFRARKGRLGVRVFGVAIATTPSQPLRAISDTIHLISDLTEPSEVRALFRI